MARIKSLAAAGMLVAALCGPARAEDLRIVDEDGVPWDCNNTPIDHMTRGRLKECEIIERAMRGINEEIAKLREKQASEDQARAAPRAECHPTADIICERWPPPGPAASNPPGRGRTK